MKYLSRSTVVAIAAAIAVVAAWPAVAGAQSTTFITASDIVLSSPANTYGPWTIESIRSSNKIANGAVDLEVTTRADHDRPFPTSGVLLGLGYTHDVSSRMFYNASVKLGSAGLSPLPAYDVHGELGFKVSPDRRLVLNVADDYSGYTHGITSNEILVGPTYYGDGYVLQARLTETANTASITRLGGLAAIDVYTSRRLSKITAAAQFGPASYESALPGVPLATGDFTGGALTLSTLQWFNDHFGVTAGVQYVHLTNTRNGALLYNGRGVTLGLALR